MVDPGEVVTATVYREFCEEALNSLEMSESEKEQLAANIRSRFGHGDVVYRWANFLFQTLSPSLPPPPSSLLPPS